MKRLLASIGTFALVSALAPACLYDDSHRCGPHQHIISDDRCECDEGYASTAAGCQPCGENESSVGGECVCTDGYARATEGAACEPIPEELGAACDTESAPCTSKTYSLCHVTDGTQGYCTSACSQDGDCAGGYRCHLDGADSYCRRPPLGHGDSCDNDGDCADGEATFCETLQSHLCLVPCSAGNTDACFEGEVCCDYAVFAPICVPGEACASNGGTVVP